MKEFNPGAIFVDARILRIAAPAALLLFLVYTFLPAFLIPGNDVRFQLQLTLASAFTNPLTMLALLVLSLGSGYVIAFQWRLFRRRQIAFSAHATGTAASSVLTAVFASAACTSCLAALFPFLGATVIVSLAEYRWHFVAVGFVFIGASLYFSMKQYLRVHKDK